MKLVLVSTLALGLTLAACDNGVTELENEGNTVEAPTTSERDELAMGNPERAVANKTANRVSFALDSAELSSEARQQLTQIASAYGKSGDGIELVGFTDTTGTANYNQELAANRARVVKAFLIAQGISADEIDTEAEGETPQNVQTADGVREPANRRVRIEIGDLL